MNYYNMYNSQKQKTESTRMPVNSDQNMNRQSTLNHSYNKNNNFNQMAQPPVMSMNNQNINIPNIFQPQQQQLPRTFNSIYGPNVDNAFQKTIPMTINQFRPDFSNQQNPTFKSQYNNSPNYPIEPLENKWSLQQQNFNAQEFFGFDKLFNSLSGLVNVINETISNMINYQQQNLSPHQQYDQYSNSTYLNPQYCNNPSTSTSYERPFYFKKY